MNEQTKKTLEAFDAATPAPSVSETAAKIRTLVMAHDGDSDGNKEDLAESLRSLADELDGSEEEIDDDDEDDSETDDEDE